VSTRSNDSDLIELVLRGAYGKDWWTTAVPAKVQNTANDHMDAEAKAPWHSKRGRREID
jgi:succinate dehydrogenase flavin-adding protein (antitoxin of CptAB toxin-antitoxin module)